MSFAAAPKAASSSASLGGAAKKASARAAPPVHRAALPSSDDDDGGVDDADFPVHRPNRSLPTTIGRTADPLSSDDEGHVDDPPDVSRGRGSLASGGSSVSSSFVPPARISPVRGSMRVLYFCQRSFSINMFQARDALTMASPLFSIPT